MNKRALKDILRAKRLMKKATERESRRLWKDYVYECYLRKQDLSAARPLSTADS